ncbi:hypothetical protein BOSE62_80245 [Bosea sp. 62]|nr:hypothetical protein BOSE21B_20166 [Bosea sp. 21B]CAD5275055.1 hypothetical protein BOSE46_20460 [Bosea sp. 46]VVT59217.1 hypothetical protein BOS5A_210008 [Bosea sp. EC-HK365B]VXC23668.1 hypothetical protein BOSE127_170560 [Bosea sp. 127]VXC44330.1 hypothetical protein BOSE29B_31002 [Bosea sp. 29B]VXC68065.1 hypothetical protein BOSE125_30608 [Bosea sp. 125]VXC97902.1 hypothetical protein BOSE62_80245 [Bosea sp. 62]
MFMTIEDETGVANLVIWQTVFEKYRRILPLILRPARDQ